MSEPAQTLARIDALISRAQRLRAAGVLTLSLDGITVAFAPLDPEPAQDRKVDGEDDVNLYSDYRDPLNDPSTYSDGRVPGLDEVTDAQ